MKRIGSFSSAIGLIFLGVWMIININDSTLAKEIIKWWPLLIVILGIEILVHSASNHENKRLKLSGLFIPILIVFIIINSSNGFNVNLDNGLNIKLGNIFSKDNFNINFNGNWKSIESSRTLEAFGNTLTFNTDNGDIKIEKSKDQNIHIDATIYVNKSKDLKQYDIPAAANSDGYSVVINDSYIKSVKATIYIPEGYNVNIDGNNLQIKSSDSIVKSKINIKMDNGNVDLRGDIETSDIQLNNGKVYLKNKLCKDIHIELDNGTASLDTEDENISVDMDIDLGPCQFNNIKSVNSGIKNSIGTGAGKVVIKLDNGVASVNTNK